MVSMRRSTLFCNHLPQFSYHQLHQDFSISIALTVCSKAAILCSRSASVADTLGRGDLDLECPAATQGLACGSGYEYMLSMMAAWTFLPVVLMGLYAGSSEFGAG